MKMEAQQAPFSFFICSFPRALINTILHTKSLLKALVLLALLIVISSLNYIELLYHNGGLHLYDPFSDELAAAQPPSFKTPSRPSSQLYYFENRRNFLNDYFAKLSWGWTLLCVVPVVLVSSILYSGLQLRMIIRHILRIVINHCVFLCITKVVLPFGNNLLPSLGHCTVDQFSSMDDCINGGHEWANMDISGHSFLLPFCIFVLTEECQTIHRQVWNCYVSLVTTKKATDPTIAADGKRSKLLLRLHSFISPVMIFLEWFGCIQVFLLGTVFIATQMYHHTFTEKLLGYVLGVMSWYTTYRLLYGGRYEQYGPAGVNEGHLNPIDLV